MVSQHIKGRRPISLESAIAYAHGFKCDVRDISPRLANEIAEISQIGRATSIPPSGHFGTPVATVTDPAPLALSADALGLAQWFDRLPNDPLIRAPAVNRVMQVLIHALDLAEQGQSLGSLRLVFAEPAAVPTNTPTQPVKPGTQSA